MEDRVLHGDGFWTTSVLVDDEAILHYRFIGEITTDDAREPMRVEVTQREDLDFTTRPITTIPSVAEVTVDGHRMTTAMGRELAGYVVSAVDVADAIASGQPPASGPAEPS